MARSDAALDIRSLLAAQYIPGQKQGHYESFFFRANHPSRPLAFWIRYTLFSPHRHPERAIGELWGIWFDGESERHVAVKKEVPIGACTFSRNAFDVRIEQAGCRDGHLWGEAHSADGSMAWELAYAGNQEPLLLLPQSAYRAPLPRAKSLVGLPLARFQGWIRVGETQHEIRDWCGSQNHNWGSQHTDSYAWGQVAGFDNAPDTFLEVATARLKIAGVWTPPFTPLVLRHGGAEYAFTGTLAALRARGKWNFFTWQFTTGNDQVTIAGRITAPASRFVALRYYNPPGGEKYCLNSKLACCELQITHRQTSRIETLRTEHRAAFEILTDRTDHGLHPRV